MRKSLIAAITLSLLFNSAGSVFAFENKINFQYSDKQIYRITEKINENNIVAVSNIYNNTGLKDADYLSTALADSLVNRLVEKSENKFSVVERVRFESVTKEIGIQNTGLIDTSTITKVGNLIGANQIITGSLSQISNALRLNLRIIDVKTGKIISAFTEDGKSEHEIFSLVDRISDKVAARLRDDNSEKNITIPNLINRETLPDINIDKTTANNDVSPHIWISSIFVPGLGQLLLGEPLKGVGIFLLEALLSILTFYSLDTFRYSILGLTLLITQIILYGYNIFDAYNINQDRLKITKQANLKENAINQNNLDAPNGYISYQINF